MKRTLRILLISSFFAVITLLSVALLATSPLSAEASSGDVRPDRSRVSTENVLYLPIIVRLPCPANNPIVDFGEVTAGNISVPTDSNAYSFCGTAGDIIRLDISKTSGNINPQVDIYRSDGSEICSQYTIGNAFTMVCTLDRTGTYTILVSDRSLDATGGYVTYMQRLNNPVKTVPVNFAEVVTGSTLSTVENKAYTFSGSAGDIIRLDISKTSGGINPQVDIYRPDGTEICSQYTIGSALTMTCTLDTHGTYTILVSDRGLNGTGGFAFTMQRLNNPVDTVPANFAEVITGSTLSIVENKTYAFSGSAGDIIRLDISSTSGEINPQVDVYREDGSGICSNYTIGDTFTMNCTLDANGTYTILVFDRSLNAIGGFAFYMQRLNNPVDTVPVSFAEVVAGSTLSIVQNKAHTFSGSAGDIIRLDISSTSGDINPQVDIYREDGSGICSNYTIGDAFTMDCTLDNNGTYTILIFDRSLNAIGGFAFYLQRLNNPVATVPVNFAEVVTGSTLSIVQNKAYTFSGSAGDIIRLDISSTSGDINPQVDIYRADGSGICSNYTIGDAFTMNCTLDSNGTYTILVFDRSLNAIGGFAFYMQRLNNPVATVPVNFAEVVTGSTLSIVQNKAYTFSGSAGDIIRFDTSSTSGDINPQVDIYRADGSGICSGYTIGDAFTMDCTLDANGTYTILVFDRSLNAIGGFSFFMQRLNNPTNPTAINFGDTVAGSTLSIVQQNSYTFSGTSGNKIRIDVSVTSGSLNPQVDVYRDDGSKLCGQYSISGTLSLECTLDSTGTFTFLAGDRGLNATGSYQLSLSSL
jgi:hypothetical protein